MKLLITTGLFPPDIGGPATYSKILAEELSIRGVRVAVLSFGLVRKLPRFIRHLVYFFKVIMYFFETVFLSVKNSLISAP